MTGASNSNNSTSLHAACAIVFILFVFIYLFFFQSDLLFMVQHVLSGGATHYDRLIGTIVITAVLYLVYAGAKRLYSFKGGLYAVNFFPSLLMLTALTGVDSDFCGNPFSEVWIWLTPSLLVIYVLLALFLRYVDASRSHENTSVQGITELWRGLLLMSVMFILVCICANSNRTFHFRLRVERLLSSGSFAKALEVGNKSDDTDASLTMLRIYALSNQKQLGERLFEYPVTGGSAAL